MSASSPDEEDFTIEAYLSRSSAPATIGPSRCPFQGTTIIGQKGSSNKIHIYSTYQADASIAVDVRMIDASREVYLRAKRLKPATIGIAYDRDCLPWAA